MLLETEVCIGDRHRAGVALLEVSQPRAPCFKLAIKMGTPNAIQLCLHSAMTGFYFRVIEEGMVEAGDTIECEFVNHAAPTVDDVHRLYFLDKEIVEGLRKASRCATLEAGSAKVFAARLEKLDVSLD